MSTKTLALILSGIQLVTYASTGLAREGVTFFHVAGFAIGFFCVAIAYKPDAYPQPPTQE